MSLVSFAFGLVALAATVAAPTEEGRLATIASDAAAHSAIVKRWQDLPQSLRDGLALHGIRGMSDADGPFSATDHGFARSRIRLLFAMTAQGYWFVCYETGGYAHLFHVAVWSPDPPYWSRSLLHDAYPAPASVGPAFAGHRIFPDP